MAGFGWLVPAISWPMVALVLVYCLVWVFLMGAVRIVSERLIDHQAPSHRRHRAIVEHDFRPLPH